MLQKRKVRTRLSTVDSSGETASGVFDRIFGTLTEQAGRSKHLMIDATHLKTHRIHPVKDALLE
ncbi:hypothetical protein FXF46_07475 [Gluconobacter thailandicus]|uniref:Transposase n=1 Tax=Gluconobacter thailandicus TaxID=257438 RepID=A0AAP9ESJ7_GLUTH|nr:hypothetical protein FXF46_07475 [Gluconobacter thailandicus]